MSERHIKLCREAIEAPKFDDDASFKEQWPATAARWKYINAHPPELLLAMHEIPRYTVKCAENSLTRTLTYCNGCNGYNWTQHFEKQGLNHDEGCPVARYEEMTNDCPDGMKEAVRKVEALLGCPTD